MHMQPSKSRSTYSTENLRLLFPVLIENGPNRQYLCTCGYARGREHKYDGHIYATVCRTANSQRTVCHDKAVKTLFDFLTKVQPDGHWKLAEAAGGRAGKKCSR